MITLERAPMRAAGDRLQAIQDRLRQRVGDERFERYFAGGRALSLEEGSVRVAAGTPFLARMLKDRYAGAIEEAAQVRPSADPALPAFRIVVDGQHHEPGPAVRAHPTPVGTPQPGPPSRPAPRRAQSPLMRLEHFVSGAENRLALEAVSRVTTHAGQEAAPPVLLVGGCGSGKTHLLQGAVAALRARRDGIQARFVCAEAFANEFIAAIRTKRVEAFRKTYRALDLICIDDVHALETKPATQLELQHTIDAVCQRGGTFIASTIVPLRQAPGLRSSLSSRLSGGVAATLGTPGPSLLAEAAARIATRRGLILDGAAAIDLVRHGLDGRALTSVREVEGAVVRIEAVQRLLGGAIGGGVPAPLGLSAVLMARREMQQSARVHRGPRRPVRPDEVVDAACQALRVERQEVMSSGRHARVVIARAVAAWLCRRLTTLSYPEIARVLGRPNHSTIITACRRLEGQIAGGLRLITQPGAPEVSVGDLCETLSQRLLSAPGPARP